MPATIPDNLADEVKRAAGALLEQLARIISGRTFSPRIKLLSIEQVEEATGLGKSTIYRMIEEGRFPKPQKDLGVNRWREAAMIAWAERNDPNREGA